ncbi:MAG: Holliday junction branch migration DNA helicase RuvB [Actinomycetota bacterium]
MSDLLDPAASVAELEYESALRPRTLSEFVGQERVRAQLSLLLKAAKLQSRVPDHILLAGPPGLGKTTLAMIIAGDLESGVRISSGPTIQHAGDLAAILSSLTPGEVLFIDEIHRMARPAEELLYLAMEDFRVDVMVGKGAGASSISLELAPFTLVGATTRSGLLPNPLRDRFGYTANLEFYGSDELSTLLAASAAKLDLSLSMDAANLIALRARGTPRVANRLLRRVRDFALVEDMADISKELALRALELFEVDSLGLDRLDKQILSVLITKFEGRPVGLSTLAVAVGEEIDTIESVVEPYLLREGLIERTPKGRLATPAAYRHFGLNPPLTP